MDDTSPKEPPKGAREVPVDVEIEKKEEEEEKAEKEEREAEEEKPKKKHKFYVQSPDETEDTELELEEVAARGGQIGTEKQKKQQGNGAKSNGRGSCDKSTTFGSSTDVSTMAMCQATGNRRDQQQFASSTSSRSLSEMLRSKLASLPVREEGNFTLGFTKVFHTRTRFLLIVLCLLCLASVWSNILCFNFAIICIDHNEKSANERKQTDELANLLNENGTDQNGNGTFSAFANANSISNSNGSAVPAKTSKSFTPRQKLYLTSAVAAAALVANFAVVTLVNNYGIRTVFVLLGFLSAVATCLLPTAIELGFFYVLACRMLQGVTFSCTFPVIGAFTSKWTYYKQNGLFVSVLVAYVQFAPAVTLPISGALCELFGWPSVFFAHGSASCVLFTVFAIFFRNSPNKHPFVGEVELRKIAVGKSELSKENLKKIPLKQILMTGSVWAVWIAAIGNFVCVNMMFLYSPSYLNSVLHFPVAHTGVSASLAPLAQFGIKLFAGFTSDKIRAISETNKLRLYNSIAFFGSALFLAMLAFFPTEYPSICLGLLGISAGLLGFTTGGFFKAGPLVAKHFALVVMGQISLAITVTLLLVPIMQNTFAPHNTAEEWRSVFLITAATLALTNVAFCFLCSAEAAEWATDEFSRSASRNKVHCVEATQAPQINVPKTLG
ncbi:hypothetical protein niasHS_010028 [Heterodera schachtii]|uniref:Major facilitator superfamily (MFS) profile domain-containing protein n=2 Tax=Heterodera TaxID=34509 RepID=A0ABD2IYJ1_HETSC